MRVLVACEFSGVVREAFRKRGHEAISVDLLVSEQPGPHWLGTIENFLRFNIASRFDLLIAHPPCTYLTNAGVRHLHSIPSKNGKVTSVHGEARWQAMREGAAFFNLLKNLPIHRICVENPIPHRYAREIIGEYQQIIQPWQFGHPENKATCLWLKNLPPLSATRILAKPDKGYWDNQTPGGWNKLGPSPTRWLERSRTYYGIGEAMAEQWGALPVFAQCAT